MTSAAATSRASFFIVPPLWTVGRFSTPAHYSAPGSPCAPCSATGPRACRSPLRRPAIGHFPIRCESRFLEERLMKRDQRQEGGRRPFCRAAGVVAMLLAAGVGGPDILPRGIEVIELGSATVMPGLIDLHCHPLESTDSYQIDHLRWSSAY